MSEFTGMFAGRERSGKDWLRRLPPEERKIFSQLGHRRLSLLDVDWHALGGQARVPARCEHCGRFTGKEKEHRCPT